MAKLTKKQKAQQGKVDSTKLYAFAEAIVIVKDAATAKFDESIDVAVQLGIDAKKSDQVVRGAVVLPNGTGKTTRVAVFAQGAKADEAKAAGADIVGMDDLAAMVKAGDMPFDVVIAAPDAMRVVGLALDRDARLRVLCSGSNREGARVVFHSVQRGHGAGNGSYRPYAPDEREDASHSVALVLCMGAINGVPPAVKVPRPRNKRARAQGLDTASNAALSRA